MIRPQWLPLQESQILLSLDRMPADVTIFAAKYLVFIGCALAALVWLALARQHTQSDLVRWLVAAAALLVLSFVLAQVAGALYNDPRPFTTSHVPPLIAHAPDNGFPSDHALLAAALVALVGLLSVRAALPFVLFAVLVDWARVGAGIHHPIDVIGSSLIVGAATLAGIFVARLVAAPIAARLPAMWKPAPRPRNHAG